MLPASTGEAALAMSCSILVAAASSWAATFSNWATSSGLSRLRTIASALASHLLPVLALRGRSVMPCCSAILTKSSSTSTSMGRLILSMPLPIIHRPAPIVLPRASAPGSSSSACPTPNLTVPSASSVTRHAQRPARAAARRATLAFCPGRTMPRTARRAMFGWVAAPGMGIEKPWLTALLTLSVHFENFWNLET